MLNVVLLSFLKFPLNINKKNLGYQPNLIKAISLSNSEFVWTIGDDDLLTPDSLNLLNELFEKFKDIDFYYINSFHLDYEYLKKFIKCASVFNCNLANLGIGTTDKHSPCI